MTVRPLEPRGWSDPRETLVKASRLIDADSGVIRMLHEYAPEPDEPQIFGFGALLGNTSRYGVEDFGLVSGSTSLVREQAAAGAIGEAVERYASRFVPYSDLIWGSFNELSPKVVHPSESVLYDEDQYDLPDFPYRRPDPDEVIPWIPAFSLSRGEEYLLAADLVFMQSVDEGKRPLVQQTTNGLACGNTLEEAVLAGLYEVIERDASMLTWFTGTISPALDVEEAADPRFLSCLHRFETARIPVRVMDMTSDLGIPCVLAACTLGGSFGGIPVFSTAANLSMEKAAANALKELAQCIPWVKAMFRTRKPDDYPPIDRLSSPEDHVMWSADPGLQNLLEFLTSSTEAVSPRRIPDGSGSDVLADIRECVVRLRQHGLEVLFVDISPPDIADVGLRVVRVVVLSAQPLYFGSGLWRIGPRVHRARTDAGRRCGPSINYSPHPFP